MNECVIPLTVSEPDAIPLSVDPRQPAPQPRYQEKSVTVTQNGGRTVTPDEGYDALSSVEVETEVPVPVIEPLTVGENGTYTAEDGRAYSPVTVAVPAPNPDVWARPAGWPDLDALANTIVGDVDCIYLTYDLTKTVGYGWIAFLGTTSDSSAWTVERGHVENGAFVSDYSQSVLSRNIFRESLDEANGTVQLWRVSATGHFTAFGFAGSSDTQADNIPGLSQPCVERSGKLPWLATLTSTNSIGVTATSYITAWMERDSVVTGYKHEGVVYLNGAYSGARSLKSIDFSKWDTSKWSVSSLNQTFINCVTLPALDLSYWDVSGWNVTDVRNIFASCFGLKTIIGTDRWGFAGSIPAANILAPGTCISLVNFDGIPYSVSHNYTNSINLSVASLVKILTGLPEVTSSPTITIGPANRNKLTADQSAIATQKGWTVA